MPKYRYTPDKPKKREEKFFDFRDVQTKPAKWTGRTPHEMYQWTELEIHQSKARSERRERLKKKK